MINRRSSHNVETSTLCGSELAFNTDCVPNRQPKDARERKRMSAMKLSPRWRKLLLTIHVASAVSVLGTDLVLLVLGISSVRGAYPQTIYPAAHLVATWLLAPLALVALGTGVLLGSLTQWSLLRYWWVTIKLALTAILTGVILFVLVPRLGVAADAATALNPRPFTDAERLPLMVAT